MLNTEEIKQLKELAKESRINILNMVHNSKSGHIGGAFSATDIITVLYHKCMNITPEMKDDRDRFVLSKGHASAILYSVLSQKVFFPKEELLTFRIFGSRLQGHPCKKLLNGVEVSTGSLGQGLSIGCGMATGLKLDKNPAHVFVYLGDGELQEGSCWEAFMQAPHRKLNNLIAIIDRNRYQIDGCTEDIMSVDPLEDKIKAFNWNTIVIDGHNIEEIYDAIEKAKNNNSDRPTAIIANTVKGKGVSFMENTAAWHGKAPNDEQYEKAMAELNA